MKKITAKNSSTDAGEPIETSFLTRLFIVLVLSPQSGQFNLVSYLAHNIC